MKMKPLVSFITLVTGQQQYPPREKVIKENCKGFK